MTSDARVFNPDWVSPPGDTLQDVLDEKGWTQMELADRIALTKKHVNAVVRAKASISPLMATRLEAVLGVPAEFWLERDGQYRAALERRKTLTSHEGQVDWLTEFPLGFVQKNKWLELAVGRRKAENVDRLLRYFGVASVEAWRTIWEKPLAAYRTSAKFEQSVGATALWIRRCELSASEMELREWDANGFASIQARLREFTLESNPAKFLPKLQEECARHGVSVVFEPAPPGCRASGATRWLRPDAAMIALSLRHKTDDHLWFTFFHECAHLLKHRLKLPFLDLEDAAVNALEAEANTYARDLLIPASSVKELRFLNPTEANVRRFAAKLKIAPGLVVGRLQADGLLAWSSRLNELKIRYTWGIGEGEP